MKSEVDEPDQVLHFDPFAGDQSGPGDRELGDRIVRCRKATECGHCKGGIRLGDEYRKKVSIVDGQLMTARWCAACCAAMLAELRSQGESFPFERRFREEPRRARRPRA